MSAWLRPTAARYLHGYRVEARIVTFGVTPHERLDLVRVGHLRKPLRDFYHAMTYSATTYRWGLAYAALFTPHPEYAIWALGRSRPAAGSTERHPVTLCIYWT